MECQKQYNDTDDTAQFTTSDRHNAAKEIVGKIVVCDRLLSLLSIFTSIVTSNSCKITATDTSWC